MFPYKNELFFWVDTNLSIVLASDFNFFQISNSKKVILWWRVTSGLELRRSGEGRSDVSMLTFWLIIIIKTLTYYTFKNTNIAPSTNTKLERHINNDSNTNSENNNNATTAWTPRRPKILTRMRMRTSVKTL